MSRDEELDMGAVQRDEEIIEALAARRPVKADYAAVRLLAALAADVDEEAAPAARTAPVLEPAARAVAERRRKALRRRLSGRGIVALTVCGALVSVSGVATAVTGAVTTGDPLKPFKKVMSVVGGEERKPSTSAPTDEIERKLREADEALHHGDRATAERKLREAREAVRDLPDPATEAGAKKKIESLERKLRGGAEKAERPAASDTGERSGEEKQEKDKQDEKRGDRSSDHGKADDDQGQDKRKARSSPAPDPDDPPQDWSGDQHRDSDATDGA
ncbi:hypothetical protein C3Y87_03260 [Carbonactinospora thermoautotrophica]|uniref:hypothetical protein n=1 Tax=Carbonactinospora thermoautotrophica TaxID=1469144 RepID=UPI00226D67C4|nr:hypothetical protein [Carbonactinospora thermoautotrophica]MCX9190450.1 hypothetical protein [Carbonactinospora thermoautotrophica]